MTRSERHRLKENELSHALNEATARLAERQRMFTVAGAIVIVAAVAAAGYWAWHTRSETQARTRLTDAIAIMQSDMSRRQNRCNGSRAQRRDLCHDQ
jgi:hypothetical protein